MTIKITNRRSFTKGIAQEVINQMLPAIFDGSKDDFLAIVGEEIKVSFGENETVKGIYGFYQGDEVRDIQAIFGLTDLWAKSFIDFTINEIDNGLNYKVFRGRDGQGRFAQINTITVSLSQEAQDRFFNELMNSPYASYINETTNINSGYPIPWLEWLINGYTTEASIDFSLTSKQLQNSRSGRAIMSRGDFPWIWTGHNFLSEIFEDSSFIERSEKRIKDYMEQTIGRLFG